MCSFIGLSARLELAKSSGRDSLPRCLGPLAEHLGRFVSTNTSTPNTALFFILVREIGLGCTDNGGKITLILALHFLKSNHSRGLLVNNSTETSFAFYNDIRDTHLATKGREKDDELDGVNIMSNNDEGRLLGFNESDDVIETVFNKQGLLCVLGRPCVGSGSGSSRLQTSLLVLLRLGTVFIEEFEQLGSRVLVQSVRELGNGRWNLETLMKDNFLSLKTNVFRPLDEASQVCSRTDVLTDTKVLSVRLEERVFFRLGCLAGTEGSSSGFLTGSGLGFGRLVIETKSAMQSRKVDNAPRSSSANVYCYTRPSIESCSSKSS